MNVEGATNALFRPGFEDNFRDTYETFPVMWSRYLKSGTMDRPEVLATILAGLNRMYERGDGEPVTFDTIRQGAIVQGVDREYAVALGLTRRAVEDDQYGKLGQAAKWLGRAAALTYEYKAAALLDDAFTGTNFLGIDGLKLCSTVHTLIGSSSTVANVPTTLVGLSVTGIESLQDLMMTTKDENGDPIVSMASKFVCGNGAGMLNRARQIFGSDKEPYTADNQDNPIKREFGSMEIIVNPYMATATNYFLIDEKLNDAHLLVRRAVKTSDWYDNNTQVSNYQVDTRFLVWFVNWRGWYGMNPA